MFTQPMKLSNFLTRITCHNIIFKMKARLLSIDWSCEIPVLGLICRFQLFGRIWVWGLKTDQKVDYIVLRVYLKKYKR